MIVVKIEYNTDENGNWVDAFAMEEPPCTLHGPFENEDIAYEWMCWCLLEDKDHFDVYIETLPDDTKLFINKVDPKEMKKARTLARKAKQAA